MVEIENSEYDDEIEQVRNDLYISGSESGDDENVQERNDINKSDIEGKINEDTNEQVRIDLYKSDSQRCDDEDKIEKVRNILDMSDMVVIKSKEERDENEKEHHDFEINEDEDKNRKDVYMADNNSRNYEDENDQLRKDLYMSDSESSDDENQNIRNDLFMTKTMSAADENEKMCTDVYVTDIKSKVGKDKHAEILRQSSKAENENDAETRVNKDENTKIYNNYITSREEILKNKNVEVISQFSNDDNISLTGESDRRRTKLNSVSYDIIQSLLFERSNLLKIINLYETKLLQIKENKMILTGEEKIMTRYYNTSQIRIEEDIILLLNDKKLRIEEITLLLDNNL